MAYRSLCTTLAVCSALGLVSPIAVLASDTATATKTDTPPSTTSSGFFAIPPPGQIVQWHANYFGSGTQGNGFYLHDDNPSSPLNQIAVATGLSSGSNSGTKFLAAGNYEISITYLGMGPGNYSITYNLDAEISASPTSHNFGDHDEGTTSSTKTFTITNTGDFDLVLGMISNTDPAHFEITDNPSGQNISTGSSRTLKVRFVAGSAGGSSSPVPRGSTLTISASGAGVPTVSPVSISLQGRTIPLVPEIQCCASGTVNLGSADYTVPETITGTVCFRNVGGAPLVVSSVTLINDQAAAPFSITSGGGAGSLAPGGSRNVTLLFSPPPAGGEATYTGSLQINSNDPDDPTILCSFRARAHHPVPIMVVSPSTLDYHEVEIGFAFTKAFEVRNTGDAQLTGSVGLDATFSNADQPHWSSLDLGAFSIAPGGSRDFLQVYEPNDLGNHQIHLLVTGNDVTNPDDPVTLRGEGVAPIPIDAALVLDRSGSMADPAGSVIKIVALQSAADLFTHLLAQRNAAPTPFGDKLGFAKYNDSYGVYLNLDTISGVHLTSAEDALSNSAINDASRIKPQGLTSIGGGMEAGASLLVGSPDSHKQILVVLTDGIENRSPWISTVLPTITSDNPDLMIYSVGLGSDHDPAKLQQITNVSNGYHQVQDNLSGTSRFDLEAFYFKIFVNAAGMSLVVDPTHIQLLNSPNPQIVDEATVTSSDRTAVFLALEIPPLRAFYDLELVDPQGHVILPGTTVGGVPVHVLSRMNYRIFRVIFPDVSQAQDYVGLWKLRLTPNGTWDQETVKVLLEKYREYEPDWISPFEGETPIGFAAAVGSNYKMEVQVLTDSYVPGANVTLTAHLTDRGWPAPDGEVFVTATTPNGNTYAHLKMYDDGTHGDGVAGDAVFTRPFAHTSQAGSYKFFYRGLGRNDRGELTPREDTRYLSLTVPKPDPGRGDGECIPCRWVRWLWAFVIALLLTIALGVYRRRSALR